MARLASTAEVVAPFNEQLFSSVERGARPVPSLLEKTGITAEEIGGMKNYRSIDPDALTSLTSKLGKVAADDFKADLCIEAQTLGNRLHRICFEIVHPPGNRNAAEFWGATDATKRLAFLTATQRVGATEKNGDFSELLKALAEHHEQSESRWKILSKSLHAMHSLGKIVPELTENSTCRLVRIDGEMTSVFITGRDKIAEAAAILLVVARHQGFKDRYVPVS